tara:strand:+ start:34 stop:228 length:195 start_codon:yes stop_codon:yes gene_type:complete
MPYVKNAERLNDLALDRLSKYELVQLYKNLFDKYFLLSQECDNLREDLLRRINHIRNMKGLPNV